MPRPLQDKMPVPYTSEGSIGLDGEQYYSVSNSDTTRQRECCRDNLCMLCGEPLTKRSVVIACYGDDDNDEVVAKTPKNRFALERGAFHERCGRMTLRHCPTLRDDTKKWQPELWVGSTATFTPNGDVPKGWRRLKTTEQRLRQLQHSAALA